MWPKLSNINKDIHDKITNRNNLEASKLNCWVRLFSGVGDGLIMVSNPDTQLFAAAGEGGIYGFAGAGDEAGFSGTLGNKWGTLKAGEFTPGKHLSPEGGRSLRPSPMVTSLEFSEGEDQISRSGKISLKVFSLEQMELIQEYFMEPGYNLFIEWGWNTPEGASGLIKTDDPNKIPSLAAAGNLVQSSIRSKALNTSGDYDNMMGFIVGGTVGNDGENFSVEIELRGTPELPSYLQQQNVVFSTIKSTGKIYPIQGSNGYGPGELVSKDAEATEESDPAALGRRFANMFNGLPSHRQTNDVKVLDTTYKIEDLINCDSLITNNIDTWVKDTTWWGGDQPLEIGSIAIERQKLFSKHKYIRFEKALDIIQASGLTSYTIGDEPYECSIDISNTKIGAFPLIFSTKPESLLISGFLPDFKKYFLQEEQPDYDGITGENTVNNSINGISFVESGPSTTGHTEQGKYWGYLKNLYINQEMLVDKIASKNRNIREVLYDVLNELSSAVNSFWDFQIVEGGKDKNLVLTVIDRNWVGEKTGTPKEFYHNGEKSRFLNSSLSIDIPGEMASQIISTRLGASTKKDGPSLETGTSERKRFFAKTRDRFMSGLTVRSQETTGETSTIQGKKDKIDELTAEMTDMKANAVSTRPRSVYGTWMTDYVNPETREVVYTVVQPLSTGYSIPEPYDTEKGDLAKKSKEKAKLVKQVNQAKTSNVTSSVDKIDIVPNPMVVNDMESVIKSEVLLPPDTPPKSADVEAGKDPASLFDKNFKIYTFRDTNLFDVIKSQAMIGKSTGRLSHPLPIKYSFTILGSSGIRRGDMFNIIGIPEKYKKYGLFQVNSVEHSIEGMKWTTAIEGLYRQTQ